MATFNKFQDFVEQLAKGVHHLHAAGDTLKVYLSNEAPLAADTVKADIADITAQNGYPAGGSDIQNDLSESSGTVTVTAQDVTFTASGGSFGPFRYAIIYNDSATSPADALVAYFDYGTSISVNNGESFVIDFGASLLTIT
jgi:hypothetical protein